MIGRLDKKRGWVLPAILFVYWCVPLAWALFAVRGTAPPLSGGDAGHGELAAYATRDLADRLEASFGILGDALLLPFFFAFFAPLLLLRGAMARRRERGAEESTRESRNEMDARLSGDLARATLEGRIRALWEVAENVESQWPGAGLAGGSEALLTMRRCTFVRRKVSEVIEEEAAFLDAELLARLDGICDSVGRCEQEARSVIASLN